MIANPVAAANCRSWLQSTPSGTTGKRHASKSAAISRVHHQNDPAASKPETTANPITTLLYLDIARFPLWRGILLPRLLALRHLHRVHPCQLPEALAAGREN